MPRLILWISNPIVPSTIFFLKTPLGAWILGSWKWIINCRFVKNQETIKYDLLLNVSAFRYQDQLKANIRNIPENELIKLIGKIDLNNMLRQDQVSFKYVGSSTQIFYSGKLLGDSCVQKSMQSYCAECIRFKECESPKKLKLTVTKLKLLVI